MSWLLILIGIPTFLIGRWGSRNAEALVPSVVSPVEKDKRSRVHGRGGLTLQAIGVMFVCFGLYFLLLAG